MAPGRIFATYYAGNSRGQAATEILVILGVVLLIAIIGISLLGQGFLSSNDTKKSEVSIRWKSLTPIGIDEMDATGSKLTFVFLNNGNYPTRILSILARGGSIETNTTWFQPGEKKIVEIWDYGSLSPAANCSSEGGISGTTVLYDFGFTYEQSISAGGEASLITKSELSKGIPLEITCSSGAVGCNAIPCLERWEYCCKFDGSCKVEFDYCGTRQVCGNGEYLCGEDELCGHGGCVKKSTPDDECGGCREGEVCCAEFRYCYDPRRATCDACGGCEWSEHCCEMAGNICMPTGIACTTCGTKCNYETEQCCEDLRECRPIGEPCR